MISRRIKHIALKTKVWVAEKTALIAFVFFYALRRRKSPKPALWGRAQTSWATPNVTKYRIFKSDSDISEFQGTMASDVTAYIDPDGTRFLKSQISKQMIFVSTYEVSEQDDFVYTMM